MKYEKIYMSGENKKADNTDYIDYYKAENGKVIQIVELLNTSDRFYKVYNSVEDMKAYYPFGGHFRPCFERLRDAKAYVEA